MYASDLKHPQQNLEQKLRQIYTLNRSKTINLSFRPPFLNLLKSLENPHFLLPPTIHVAGTNGKGSTISLLRSILQHKNYAVHAYTSPHLIRFNERILLANQEIGDDLLESLIDETLQHNQGGEITFFEATTALAFAAFSRAKADVLLLETGLGGRLDCTNVIPAPACCVITPIGLDHAEHLGNTLQQIAAEKAGIMKPGAPCVIAPQHKETMDVLENVAAKLGVKLYRHGQEWAIAEDGEQIVFTFEGRSINVPRPGLIGTHQIANAGTALAVLEVLKDPFPLTGAARNEGLKNAFWPARLQNITKDFAAPVLRDLAGWEIWLDGAHNGHAAEALSAQILSWKRQKPGPVYLITGMMNHKDPAEFLKPLLWAVDRIAFTDIPSEPKAHAGSALLQQYSGPLPTEAYSDPLIALRNTISKQPPGRIVIAGSLYLAGHILKTCHNKAHNKP